MAGGWWAVGGGLWTCGWLEVSKAKGGGIR